jgi:hypothetical protein
MQMVPIMKVSGLMTSNMEKVLRVGQMVQDTMVSMLMERKKVRVD